MFRDRRSEGPFSEDELIGFLQSGRYVLSDLGRPEEARHWTPLRNLFTTVEAVAAPPLAEATPGAPADPEPVAQVPAPASGEETKAHHYRQLLTEIGGRVRGIFERYPLESGVICLVIGCVVVVLSFFPPLIFGPWLIAALVAGAILLLRDQMAAGFGLCAAAVFLPIFLWLLVRHLVGAS